MREPTQFQNQLVMLGKNTERAVLSTYQAMMQQGMSADDVISVLTPVLYRSGAEGEALARAELARMLSRMTGEPVTTFLSAPDTARLDRGRIESALVTTLADVDGDARLMRLGRLAYSDPIQTAQTALQAGMAAEKQVDGYVRVLNSEACELCHWLERDGYVYPSEQPMHQHPGCLCSARPVLKTITN